MVWLIYHQSEYQEGVIFVKFPCASDNVFLLVSFSGPAPRGAGPFYRLQFVKYIRVPIDSILVTIR